MRTPSPRQSPLVALLGTWLSVCSNVGLGVSATTVTVLPVALSIPAAAAPTAPLIVPTGVVAGQGRRPTATRHPGGVAATLADDGIPLPAEAAYQVSAAILADASPACHLTWQLLAAVGGIESDHGRALGNTVTTTGRSLPGVIGVRLDGRAGTGRTVDTDGGALDGDRAFDRAVGPMQLLPSTWAVVGVDGDSDGRRDPQDIDDAALGAAVFLCSGGADLAIPRELRAALLRFHPSAVYVDMVIELMSGYVEVYQPPVSAISTHVVPAAPKTVEKVVNLVRPPVKIKQHSQPTRHPTKSGGSGGSTSSTTPPSEGGGEDPGSEVCESVEDATGGSVDLGCQ